MSTAVDRRAEAAAAAVRAAVADLEPSLGATPGPAHRRWPVLLAAVVLLVAAIAGVTVFQRDDGDTVVAGRTGEVLRLMPDAVPEGLALVAATDLPAKGSSDTVTFRLYGRGDDEDPFRDGDLAVIVHPGSHDLAAPEGNVRVRGVRGDLAADEGQGGTLSWDEPDLGSVMIISWSLDGDQLLAVAEGLRREGDDLVGPPPAGFTRVADLNGTPGSGVGAGAVTGPAGATLHYQEEGRARTLTVATVVEQPGLVDAFRWMFGGASRPTEVRGHDGWFVQDTRRGDGPSGNLGIVWRERPGVVAVVGATDLSEEEVRRVADGLHPADDAGWADLLARAPGATTTTP